MPRQAGKPAARKKPTVPAAGDPIPFPTGRDVERVRRGTGATPVGPTPAARRAAESPARPGVVSLGMAERLAERSAMRRHRIWRRALAWTAGAVALGAAVWVVFWSPVLGADPAEVKISGEGTVIDLAEVEAVVAQVDGVPLPRLDTLALREEIMALNGVRDVQILRAWPDGLDVVLQSREPVAAVPVDGAFALLDQEGVRVATTDAVPDGLPEIDAPLDETGARSLHAALVVLGALPRELQLEVEEVSAATQDAVVMTLRDGAVVEWGSSQDAALKIEVLTMLRSLPENEDVEFYDVSAPTLPITR
ncbi:cell division protein FtsQ/DivIB [Oerskovia flava]|uniref:cell division protein FtsQ/DivIB n=1 Tax=Oerskovia flava TaxID=2986422 RepID=UPI00224025D3|nr:cell division protein FtsQ/DivIB [Oerskovia sp. JB1-3-2]